MKNLEYKPSFRQAAITFGAIVIVIGLGLFHFKANLHSLMLISLTLTSISAWALTKRGFGPIRDAMSTGISGACGAIFIFVLIGVLIAAFVQAGTVGALIYYGLKLIRPEVFLPACLILCVLMSLATGTSWGTVATAGIVLMAIGGAMGVPLPIVAGAIVSGACFGDKMSPVSDTTNLAAMSCEVDLYAHIKSMCFTTLPTLLITILITWYIGLPYATHALPAEQLLELLTALNKTYVINPLCLVPLLVIIVMNFMKISAEPAMMASVLVAIMLAIFMQGAAPVGVLNALYSGGTGSTGLKNLDSLLSQGGLVSIMWTMSLALIALALGGVLNTFGFLSVLIAPIVSKMKSAFGLVTTTIFGCFFGNMLMGETYMTLILGGQLFRSAYDKLGIDRRLLSRSIEEGGTLTTVLIPWTTGGAFVSSTLGVSALDYAPWAILNWLNALVAILFAFLGIAIFRKKSEHTPGSDPVCPSKQ